MRDALSAALQVAGSGLDVQSARLRVIAENIANARSIGATPGSDPYARKTITFESAVDRATGAALVKVRSVGVDPSPFRAEVDPGSPAADADGVVKTPNVDVLVELTDMRQADRAFEANLQVAKQAGDLAAQTIALLKDA